jgi:hypothetical protein
MRNHLDIGFNDPVSRLFLLERLDNAHLFVTELYRSAPKEPGHGLGLARR